MRPELWREPAQVLAWLCDWLALCPWTNDPPFCPSISCWQNGGDSRVNRTGLLCNYISKCVRTWSKVPAGKETLSNELSHSCHHCKGFLLDTGSLQAFCKPHRSIIQEESKSTHDPITQKTSVGTWSYFFSVLSKPICILQKKKGKTDHTKDK